MRVKGINAILVAADQITVELSQCHVRRAPFGRGKGRRFRDRAPGFFTSRDDNVAAW
jgi:hypothetical protein